jgi:hypothetical protein
MVFVVAGLLLLARTPIDATYAVDLLPPMILIGLGAGLGFPSLMMLAMSGATLEDSGLASGLVNTSVQVGGALGLAVLATFATDHTQTLLAEGESAASALNSGYHVAYLIGAGLVLVAIAVAISVWGSPLPAPEPEPIAEPAAEPIETPVAVHAEPLPVYADAAGGGCVETGIRVTVGCGGGAGTPP